MNKVSKAQRQVAARARNIRASRSASLTGLGEVERATDKQMETRGHIQPLTARQTEVLALYDSGLTRKKIAARLGVRSIDNTLLSALLKSGR